MRRDVGDIGDVVHLEHMVVGSSAAQDVVKRGAQRVGGRARAGAQRDASTSSSVQLQAQHAGVLVQLQRAHVTERDQSLRRATAAAATRLYPQGAGTAAHVEDDVPHSGERGGGARVLLSFAPEKERRACSRAAALFPDAAGRETTGLRVPPLPLRTNPIATMGVLAAVLVTVVALTLIGALVTLTVLVARIAQRQSKMARLDEEMLAEQLALKRRARAVASRVSAVESDLKDVQQETADYTSGAKRTSVRVDSKTALSGVAPTASEAFSASVREMFAEQAPAGSSNAGSSNAVVLAGSSNAVAPASRVLPPKADERGRWAHATDATGGKYLPGGLAAANLWARDCVLLGADGTQVCKAPVDEAGGARVQGGLVVSGAANARSARALGVDLVVSGGATSWYKIATARSAGAAAFRIGATVLHDDVAHDIDAFVSVPQARGTQQARVRWAPRGGAAVSDVLWKRWGLALVTEGADRVHLYVKAAPPASKDMTIGLRVDVMSATGTPGAAQFHHGRAPVTLGFDDPMTAAKDATLTGTVATMDVASHANTTFFVETSAGLRVGPLSALEEHAASVMHTRQAEASGAMGATFSSKTGLASHFPFHDNNTYIRPGAQGARILLGDQGAPEVWVRNSVFGESNGVGATRVRAVTPGQPVFVGDTVFGAQGRVELGNPSGEGAPVVAHGGLDVRGTVRANAAASAPLRVLNGVIVSPDLSNANQPTTLTVSSSGPGNASPNQLVLRMRRDADLRNTAVIDTSHAGEAGATPLEVRTSGQAALSVDGATQALTVHKDALIKGRLCLGDTCLTQDQLKALLTPAA